MCGGLGAVAADGLAAPAPAVPLGAIVEPLRAERILAPAQETHVDVAHEIGHGSDDRHKHLGGLSPRPVGHQQQALTIAIPLYPLIPRVAFEDGVEALDVLDRNRLAASSLHLSDQIAEELAQRHRLNSNLLKTR